MTVPNRPPASATLRGDEQLSVLDRAFDILAVFKPNDHAVLTLAEITRRVNLPKTTTHRLLGALARNGAIERTPTGYRLGILLFELGTRVPWESSLREAALPFMQDLYQATHQTINLAVLDSTEVVYVERIRGHQFPPKLASRVGGRLCAHSTALGKALLAFSPGTTQELLRKAPLRKFTPYTITTAERLMSELAEVHETKVAFDRAENALGTYCVATPVLVAGRAVAALSVTGWTSRISGSAVTSMRTAAVGLQRVLSSRAAYDPGFISSWEEVRPNRLQ